MAWKVLLTDGLESVGKDIINQNNLAVDAKGIESAELLQVIGEYDGLIVRGRTKVTKEVLDAAKNLKVVGRAGVGVDNIDLDAAKAHGVVVVNCPQATSEAVAELTMAMLLGLARELPRADASLKAEKWIKKELMGIELAGKTLGIIGFGNIGRRVGRYASAMNMKIIAFDEYIEAERIRSNGAEPVTLEDLYAQSDFITIHIPLTADSKYLFNDATFAKLKNGARIVDAARGGIIEEAALLRALESGKLAGIALDVFEKEPPLSWELAKHPKVICTPHIGAQTQEAQLRAAEDISTEVLAVLDGQELRWKIC